MANMLVVNATQQQSAGTKDKAILGFRSLLPTSVITGQAEDSSYPFGNAIDYRDNTKYSPAAAGGSVTIEFTQSTNSNVNYFAFAVHNMGSAGVSGTFEVHNGTAYQTVTTFASIKDNRPFLFAFDKITSRKQKLTLNFTKKLYIGSINIGEAVELPRPPSLGFQPGRYAANDKVEQFRTEGNNFIVGRRLSRGFNSTGSFKFISFEDHISKWFEDYMNHVLDSKTLFLKWNNSVDQVIYGVQNPKTLTKPRYTTSFHADFEFDINGYA